MHPSKTESLPNLFDISCVAQKFSKNNINKMISWLTTVSQHIQQPVFQGKKRIYKARASQGETLRGREKELERERERERKS